LSARPGYVYKIFERQTEINLANLERIHRAVGDRPSVAYVTGTDFGTQNGLLLAPKAYRQLFLPFHKQTNDWIHKHTAWKIFLHSCGSVFDLIEDFIGAGFDILNPVQTSADRMDPGELKRKFGGRITFWGGGADTQHTLPFGSAEDVRKEVCARLKLFGPGGGFVFNAVHNIQAQVPVANVLAMYDTALQCGRYPLQE
jgi:uroporphyrinogen-III decarboxylase